MNKEQKLYMKLSKRKLDAALKLKWEWRIKKK